MIRSTYRNLMLLMLILSFGVSFFVFRKTQDYQLEISARENDIIRLQQELENTQSLNVALNELDNLTITEQTATQLDILRHLGLEQSSLNFELESRDVQNVGATSLFVHRVRITSEMSYASALQLADRLQSTKKIVLDSIELNNRPNDPDGYISLNLSGRIYGLEKNLTQPQPVAPTPAPVAESPLAAAPPADVSATEAPAADISTTTGVSPSGPAPETPATPAEPAPQETVQ